jgi:hypothetical protein
MSAFSGFMFVSSLVLLMVAKLQRDAPTYPPCATCKHWRIFHGYDYDAGECTAHARQGHVQGAAVPMFFLSKDGVPTSYAHFGCRSHSDLPTPSPMDVMRADLAKDQRVAQ